MSLYDGKLLRYKWFSGRDTVGFVAIQRIDGWKAFVGVAQGGSEQSDLQYIVDWGATLPKELAIAVFPMLPAENYVL